MTQNVIKTQEETPKTVNLFVQESSRAIVAELVVEARDMEYIARKELQENNTRKTMKPNTRSLKKTLKEPKRPIAHIVKPTLLKRKLNL